MNAKNLRIGGLAMRLIDADALISKLKECISIEWNNKCAPVSWAEADANFIDDLENAPTIDAVPVVRCKECRYAFRRSGRRPLGCYLHGRNGITLHNGNDFCSYGERKEAEHDQG